ncbi:hypothetical protein L208DRAFT_1282528, partial [Tricholoma matsutake]
QLRKVVFAIKNSTTIILPQWFTILQDLKLTECMMPRNISTQWNSTFDMLDFAIEHITAINAITSNRDMKLRQYKLSEDEWDIFKDPMLFFSRGAPSIATIIPAMDNIDKHLTTAAIDNKYPLAIKLALAIGKKTLNHYYNKTDHSEVFRIAMGTYFLALPLFFSYLWLVLCPHHKL